MKDNLNLYHVHKIIMGGSFFTEINLKLKHTLFHKPDWLIDFEHFADHRIPAFFHQQ